MSVTWIGMVMLLAQDQQAREFISRFTVHGQVEIEGYGPAKMSAVVSTSCGGSVRTDSQGKFALTGSSSNQGPATCDITFTVPGCEPRQVIVARPAGGVGLGTIVVIPNRGGPAQGTTSFLSLSAPAESIKLREQARKSAARGKLPDAQRELERAVALYARDPEAWHELGLVRKQRGDDAASRAAFEQAVAADKRFALPYVQLVLLALRRQEWSAAIEAGQAAVAINGVAFPDAWLYLATAHLKRNQPAEAENAARKALDTAGAAGMPKAHHLLGVALAAQGRRAEAIAALREYLASKPADAQLVADHLRMIENQ